MLQLCVVLLNLSSATAFFEQKHIKTALYSNSAIRMSLDNPNIQYVDKYYKYIVSGFLHEIEKDNLIKSIIPDIEFGIILSLYYE